jgi:plasmid stabilization system protein ParE
MAVRWSRRALLDVADISDFYTQVANLAVADQMISRLKQAVREIAVTPMLGQIDERLTLEERDSYQQWLILNNQYRVYFHRLGPKTIEVYRVWSTRRPLLKPEQILPDK